MSQKPIPGQIISLMIVKNEEMMVHNATVLEVKENRYFLEVEDPPTAKNAFAVNDRLTLTFRLENDMPRLKGIVDTVESNEKIWVNVFGRTTKREKRAYIRIDTRLPMQIKKLRAKELDEARAEIKTDGGDIWEPTDVNISGAGLGFKTIERCNIGDFFKIQIEIPDRIKKSLNVLAEVVRMESGDKSGYLIGLKFVDATPEDLDLINSYVFKRIHSLIDEEPK